MNKLYLIDGMSVVFRAYHAMQRSGLKSPKGEPTFALFAFCNIITSLLEKETPEHIAVVFDTKAPTFRHIMYPAYKANRAAFPDDLVPQLPKIKEFLDLLSIPRVELPGFEADDIIGTLAKTATDQKIDVACLTADKDFYQLVTEHVKLYKPSKNTDEAFDIIDIDGVKDKFGVRPDQVIDVLALIGDTADNIPGVKGIGDKTAIPLIQQYGSVEGIYENIEKIDKATVKTKLIDGKESAFLAKILVTIKIDVPLDITIHDLDWKTPEYSSLDKFFAEAGFGTLRKKWGAKALKSGTNVLEYQPDLVLESPIPEEAKLQTVNTIKHEYIHVHSFEMLDSMLKELDKASILSVDLETDALDRLSCDIVGIALCAEEDKSYYISVYNDKGIVKQKADDSLFGAGTLFSEEPAPPRLTLEDTPFFDQLLPLSIVLEKIGHILTDPNLPKVGQNIKFDAYILNRFDVVVSPIKFDSMIASYLINSDEQHNLNALSEKWLNYKPIPITSLIGEKKATQKSMREIDPSIIAIYAAEDADLALKLRNKLAPALETNKLSKLADDIEFPLIEVLVRMETNGIAIDTKLLSGLSVMIDSETKKLQAKIYEEAGTDFNIDSPKQLSHILFEKLMIPTVSKTKTGFSTDVSVLTQLAPMHPIAEYMLDYRQLQKLRSTYIDALPKLINPTTGRIHTTYNQTIASTGRLSSTDPNLQNIPIRTDLGKEIRKAFVSQSTDSIILSADYSQIELRIMAFICNDSSLIDAFKNGHDIHAATAAVLYDIPITEVNSDMRRVAKTVNFGIMYGLGAFGLSQRLKIGRNEAQGIISNYFEKYPGIRKYIDSTIKFAEENGYAETICGRKRYFQNINSKNRNLKTSDERAAINLPIQGTASDMMKIAMIRVDKKMRENNMKSLMMLQVHDELVFEARLDEIDKLKLLVKEEMEASLTLGDVPVVVEVGIGNNWFTAH